MVDETNNQQQQPQHEVNSVVIVGTGLMGTGIAQVSIEAGLQVTMVGRSAEKCTSAMHKIESGVQKSVKRRNAQESEEHQRELVAEAMGRMDFKTNVFEADLSHTDLVIEAVVENLKVKQKLFADLEPAVSDQCILVTNTSSFLLQDISSKMQRQTNIGGLHFFNPVPAMKLVEVVRGDETEEPVYEALCRFCQRIGKTPVKCRDTPGFVVNRLLIPYLADAMRMAEAGNAEVKDIDTAMRLGTGHPMGPFELMDYIGLDTMKFIMDGWHQRCPEDHRYTPCKSLDTLVAEGQLGRKTGQGFYAYGNGKLAQK